jgi:hypothetical protein
VNFTPNPTFVANFLAAPPPQMTRILENKATAVEQELENEAAIILHRIPRPIVENMIGQVQTDPTTITVGILAQGHLSQYLEQKAMRPDEQWFVRAVRKIFPDWNF